MDQLHFDENYSDGFATAEWLRAKREELGMNKKTVAEIADIPGQDVSQMENDEPYIRAHLVERLKASRKVLMIAIFQLCRARNVPLEMISADHITGADIQKARIATGLSQAALSRLLKIDDNLVSQVERDATDYDADSTRRRIDGIKRRLAAHFKLHRVIGDNGEVLSLPLESTEPEQIETDLVSAVSDLSEAIAELRSDIAEFRRWFHRE